MITEIKKQPTWTDLITNLKVGEHLNVAYEKRKVIAPLISTHIKLMRPDMSFETSKKYLTIKGEQVEALSIKRVS